MIHTIAPVRKHFRLKKVVLLGSLLLVVVGVVGALTYFQSHKANAAVASDWQAGNIISDGVFYNNGTMTVQDIQTFLNQKVPTCDTNGTQMHSSTMTNAQYAATQGWPGPAYVCLKDYYQVPRSDTIVSNLSTNVIPAGAISAAQIIKNAADTYGINPQVLLVTLQKESLNLLNDNWPLPSQYTAAMGYDCTDSAPCDPQYAGFYNQVTNAARQFKLYKNSPSSYRYQPLQTNSILYSLADSGCGASDVYIANYATAGLYNYTPYQPDQAALNNLYGTGDACSSYGNRNFWRDFTDWFNSISTLQNNLAVTIVSPPVANPARGQDVSYTVSFKNNLPYDVTVDGIGIVGRLGSITGANRDFGWMGPVTLHSGTTQQYTFTATIQDVGTIYAWPAIYYAGGYIQYNNWGSAMVSHQPNLSLSSPLTLSAPNPVAGQSETLSATIKNNETVPIHIDSLGIPIRYYGQYSYDVGWSTAGTIAPGATQTVTGTTIFDKPGPYDAWVSWNLGGQFTTLSPIVSTNVATPTPNFTLTYLETPDVTPAVGEDVVLKFKLKNNLAVPMTLSAVGIVGRYGNAFSGPNRDFGWVGPETFAAGEEKSYTTFASTVSQLDNFYAWVAINYNGTYTHYNNWGFMMTPHWPNLTLSSPLTVNSGNPFTVGQTVTVSASIKNNETHPIRFNTLGIPIRYYGVYNYDATWIAPGILAASGQTGDTAALSASVKFDKPGPYTIWTSANLGGNYFTVGNPQTLNL